MEKRARTVLAATAAILTLLLCGAWVNRPQERLAVHAAQVSVQDIYNSISAPGTVEAAQSAAVSPAENAVVARVCVSVGDRVEQGDVLCTLQSAQSVQPDSSTLQAVWSAWQDGGTAAVTSSSADALLAPCTGTVLSVPEEGGTVYANLPCARVADMTNLQVRVRAPELFAGELKTGQRANISSSAAKNETYGAYVETVAPAATRTVSLTGESGAASVEALLPVRGKTEGLRPGYSVTAKIFTDFHPDAVVVPYEAIFQRGEQQCVFTVRNGVVQEQEIETGYLLEQVTEVTEGLAAGQTVVCNPPETLGAGDAVEVLY